MQKLVEDPRSKEKEYKEGVLQQNLVIQIVLFLIVKTNLMRIMNPSSEVPEQYRLSTKRLRDIVHGDDNDDDDDYEDIDGYSESGYRLVYKDNLVAALQKAHQAGKCKGRIVVVEDSDNIGDLMNV